MSSDNFFDVALTFC